MLTSRNLCWLKREFMCSNETITANSGFHFPTFRHKSSSGEWGKCAETLRNKISIYCLIATRTFHLSDWIPVTFIWPKTLKAELEKSRSDLWPIWLGLEVPCDPKHDTRKYIPVSKRLRSSACFLLSLWVKKGLPTASVITQYENYCQCFFFFNNPNCWCDVGLYSWK